MSNDEEVIERSPEGRYVRYAQKVGTGSFKTVWKGQDMDTAREVAWNTINIAHYKAALRKRIMEEVMLLRRLSHPCLLQFYGSWLLPDSMQVVFVTELFHAGTLKEFTRKYPISMAQVKKYCRSILECLVYLHTQDPPVIHRDLKCDNIFIDGADGNIKIGDLGLSTQLLPNSEKAYTVLGTPEFMAPEMYEAEYTETVDIYAFGMCVLEMITKRAPYEECANNVAAVMKAVTSGQLPRGLDELKEKWPDAYEFVHRCIVAGEHDSRPSATSLLDDDFLRIRSEDKTRPTAMVPLLEESKDGKGSDHPGAAHGAQGDAAGSVVSSVASGSNSAAAGAATPGSSSDVGNRTTADGPASGGETGSVQPLRRGEGSLSTIVAARQSDGTVVLAAVDRGESGTLDVSVVGEFAPPEIQRPAIALPDDAGPRSSTPSDGGPGVVPPVDACGASTAASHASSSPPPNASDSAAHMRASTDRPSTVDVQNSAAGSRADAVPGNEGLVDADSTAPAPASAIPSVPSTVASAPAGLPQTGATVPDTSAPVLQAPDVLANTQASATCARVSPVSQADAAVLAPGTSPMEPVRLAATTDVAAKCDPGSAAEPTTSPLPRSSGPQGLACNNGAVLAPEGGAGLPPGQAMPPATPSLEDLHRFCARIPALEAAMQELLRRQAYLAAQQEALTAAVQGVSRAVASLASQQVRAPGGGSAKSPRPVDGLNTEGAQPSPLLAKWPASSTTVPSSSPLSAHGAPSSREGAHVAPHETRSAGHHHRSPGHLVTQLDVNTGTVGGHGDSGNGTTAVAAPAYLNELDGLAHAPPLSLREGMAMIGSEESQAYYGDLNRVRQDASRKLHKLERLHEKNMKSLSEELERERAKLVPEQRRLLQKKQRMHRLQKSLETAAAEAGASVDAGDGSLSAETKKKHQKQNIERRVRLLEQTVDSAKEEYERFRHELSAKTRTVDGEFKARCATVKSSFTANVRKIKLAFNHHVARVITSNQALKAGGGGSAGGPRAASVAGPGASEEAGLSVRPADRHDETAAYSLHVGVGSLAETGLSGGDSGGTAARTASPPGAPPIGGDRGDEPPTHDPSSWPGDTGLRGTTGVEGFISDPSSRVVPPRSNVAQPTRESGEPSRIPPNVSVPFGDQPSDALLSTGGTSSDDDRGFRDTPGDGASLLPS